MCERGSGGVFVSNAVQSILQESMHAWIDRSERSLSTSAGRINMCAFKCCLFA